MEAQILYYLREIAGAIRDLSAVAGDTNNVLLKERLQSIYTKMSDIEATITNKLDRYPKRTATGKPQ